MAKARIFGKLLGGGKRLPRTHKKPNFGTSKRKPPTSGSGARPSKLRQGKKAPITGGGWPYSKRQAAWWFAQLDRIKRGGGNVAKAIAAGRVGRAVGKISGEVKRVSRKAGEARASVKESLKGTRTGAALGFIGKQGKQVGAAAGAVAVAAVGRGTAKTLALVGGSFAGGATVKETTDFLRLKARKDFKLSSRRTVRARFRDLEQERLGLTGKPFRDLTGKQRATILSRAKKDEKRFFKGIEEGRGVKIAARKKRGKVGRPRTIPRKRGPKNPVGRPKGSVKIKKVGEFKAVRRVGS